MLRPFALVGLLAAFSLTARADAPCEDPDAGGVRKGVQRRDFLKRLRAEISAWGGFYAADLVSTSYTFGGAVAFYPFEDFGIEASLIVAPISLAIERPVASTFGGKIFKDGDFQFTVVAGPVWSPAHFKLRAGEKSIVHGDLFFTVGGGYSFHRSIQGGTFDAGVGLKLYPNKYFAVRFDIRDYVIIQEAISVQRVTNNIVGTIGFSLFLPNPRPYSKAVKKEVTEVRDFEESVPKERGK